MMTTALLCTDGQRATEDQTDGRHGGYRAPPCMMSMRRPRFRRGSADDRRDRRADDRAEANTIENRPIARNDRRSRYESEDHGRFRTGARRRQFYSRVEDSSGP